MWDGSFDGGDVYICLCCVKNGRYMGLLVMGENREKGIMLSRC